MKRKLSIFFWAIVSLLGSVAAVPPPIQYTPMTTNAPAGMTNAIRNIASTLSRDLNGNNKQITNLYLVGSQLVIASNLTAGNILLVTGPSYLSGPAYGGTIVGTNFVGNGVGLTNVTASATNAQNVITPQQYGAVGNGVADDTAALLLAVSRANTGSVKILHFPAGTYRFGTAMSFTNDSVKITGEGNSSVLLATNPGMNAIEILASDDSQSFNSIEDIAIVGVGTNGATGAGIYAGNTTIPQAARNGLYVKNVRIKQFADGVLFSNWVAATFVNLHSTGNRSNAFRGMLGCGNVTFINPEMGYTGTNTTGDAHGYTDPVEGVNSRVFKIDSIGAVGPQTMTIVGGEMGNCGVFAEINGVGFTQIGGNMETFWGQYIYDFTNMTHVSILAPRVSSGVSDTIIPYHFVGGDMSAVMIQGAPYVPRTNVLMRIDSISGDATGVRRYPEIKMEATGGSAPDGQRIEFWFEGAFSSAVTNTVGSTPTLFGGNTFLGNQLVDGNLSVTGGVLYADGSGLFNLPAAGVSLSPFTNTVWFKNGDQTAFKVGADSGAQVALTNSEKVWNLVAPTFNDPGTFVGLLQYIAVTNSATDSPTNNGLHYLRYGYAQGLGAIQQHQWFANPTNSIQGDIATALATLGTNGFNLLSGIYQGNGSGLTNLTFGTTTANVNFQNGNQSGFKMGADDGATTLTTNTAKEASIVFPATEDTSKFVGGMQYWTESKDKAHLRFGYANGLGAVSDIKFYVSSSNSENNADLVIPLSIYATGMVALVPFGVANAFSGCVTNTDPTSGWTNYTYYTNGIVWTNKYVP